MSGLFRLKGQIKHYDWGGMDFIPDLLQQSNPEGKPFAEYWMGIHTQGPAELIDDKGKTSSLIKQAPQLSFLLKLLDVRDMLSIQVHPNKKMAEADFNRENALGIPLDAPTRNYKDPNHKPELMIALSSFWLLHGFRSPDSLAQIFQQHSYLNRLKEEWQKKGYPGLYKWIMELPQQEVNDLLAAPLAEMVVRYQQGQLQKSDPCFWAARAHESFSKMGEVDRGIFSIFLFNLVRLEKGEGIFQGAGVPHAYLEGQNVEIMANSDNVLRGGLTPKHIDVAELLRHVQAEPIDPVILRPLPEANGLLVYPAPVTDFHIQSIRLEKGGRHQICADRPLIILVPEGRLEVKSEESSLLLGPPELGGFVLENVPFDLLALEPTQVFIASGDKQ